MEKVGEDTIVEMRQWSIAKESSNLSERKVEKREEEIEYEMDGMRDEKRRERGRGKVGRKREKGVEVTVVTERGVDLTLLVHLDRRL